ncbi:hypothetical protein SeLEV6574_g03583 [Synchytrium endobioticum]|uniref:Uncharacterized protein n=1 Tax=Synchytrium endobioticum TaxID=286115 RepID=A0A507D3R1_9FUNG|nr:hypothetical protein SeLEV6574_g03583 [Synchytrium endobioticum]
MQNNTIATYAFSQRGSNSTRSAIHSTGTALNGNHISGLATSAGYFEDEKKTGVWSIIGELECSCPIRANARVQLEILHRARDETTFPQVRKRFADSDAETSGEDLHAHVIETCTTRVANEPIPKNIKAARELPKWESWKAAIVKEYKSLEDRKPIDELFSAIIRTDPLSSPTQCTQCTQCNHAMGPK